MKHNKLINQLFTLIWLILLAIEGLVIVGVAQLGMLPGKYLTFLAAALLCLWLFVGVLLYFGRKGSAKGNVFRIVACVLLAVNVAGCAVGATLVADLRRTLDGISGPTPAGVTMSIFVLKDNPAQAIADARDFSFAYVQDYEEARTQQVFAAVDKAIGKQCRKAAYLSIEEVTNALLSGDVDAMIINSGLLAILEENEQYAGVSQKIRILHEVITYHHPDPTNPDATGGNGPVNVVEDPFILYLSGSDTRYSTLHTSRSDVNILAVIHPVTKQILLLNTPRDAYVKNPAGEYQMDKLTHCSLYGLDCSVESLELLYGLDVNYSAEINFHGFRALIDAIGGITVHSDMAFMAMTLEDTAEVKVGENHFNGSQALAYARDRYNGGGDANRSFRQMQMIQAVIKKMTTTTTLITNYPDIIDSLEGMFSTDLGQEEMADLVKMQLNDMAAWNILSFATDGSGGSDITYSMPGQKVYVKYLDQDSIERAQILANRVMNGEILTPKDVA